MFTESQEINIPHFFINKEDVVRFVSEILSNPDLSDALTMTIRRGAYEEFYADIVIDTVSAANAIQNLSSESLTIFEEVQNGTSR